MLIRRIEGATRTIGKAQGYLALPVRDEMIPIDGRGCPSMVTAWEPTPAELAALMEGAAIHVRLVGNSVVWADGQSHPPIIVEVGPIPK